MTGLVLHFEKMALATVWRVDWSQSGSRKTNLEALCGQGEKPLSLGPGSVVEEMEKKPAVLTGIGEVEVSGLGEGVEMGVRKREVARMPLNI